MQKLGNKPCKHLMVAKNGDGNQQTAPDEVLKCWGTYFEKHLNTNWPRSEEELGDIPDNIPGLIGPPFSIKEVHKAVKAMESRKVAGADHIMAEALKAGREKMAEMLLKICNAAWLASGKVTNGLEQKYDQPSTQERVQVNPVKLPSNFPDIPDICKMILLRIDNNIDTHLSKHQFGFRKNSGTIVLSTSLIEAICDNVECPVVINSQLTEWFRKGIFSNRSISTRLKARLYGALILPIAVYGVEAWKLRSHLEAMITGDKIF